VKASGNTAVVELQEMVKTLKAELSDVRRTIKDHERSPLTVQAKTTSKPSGGVLRWSATTSFTDGNDGIIRNLQPGACQDGCCQLCWDRRKKETVR